MSPELQNSEPPNSNTLVRPLSSRGWPRWLVYLLAGAGMIYILNPGAGIFELIPDSIPLIGNLDESAAVMAVWYGLLEFMERRKQKKN